MFSVIAATRRRGVGMLGLLLLSACHISSLLTVPPPPNVVTGSAVNAQASAEQAFYAARQDFVNAFDQGGGTSVVELSGLLTDEFSYRLFYDLPTSVPGAVNIDARMTAASGSYFEDGDYALQALLAVRSELLVDEIPLQQYEFGTGRSKIGETYALIGYTEVLLGEDFCAGVPLSQALAGGGVSYGHPLTTDSLFGVAEAHFDSALAYAADNDTIVALASVGLGRVRLNRGRFAQAASAVANVPANFVYNMLSAAGSAPGLENYNFYEYGLPGNSCSDFTVSDQEGGHGMNFVSAMDPRLVLNKDIAETCDGAQGLPDSIWSFPMKFGNPSTTIPLATGIEAGLIQAESALPLNGGSASTWLAALNVLRNSGYSVNGTDTIWAIGSGQVPAQVTGLSNLSDPGTDSARASLMFRERAFWLFGTGTRLGDLRRLIRAPYSQVADSVFPAGLYGPGNDPTLSSHLPGPIPRYGSDVSLTLPSLQRTATANPYYKGCLTPASMA